VREQQSYVERIAGRHINPLYVGDAAFLFAKHLRDNVDPRDAAKMTERDVQKWFADFVKRRPAFAASPAARRQERAPVGAGTPPPPRPRAPAGTTTTVTKTFKPGQANSMSPAEARAELRKRGITY
jgi:hypothetical protein